MTKLSDYKRMVEAPMIRRAAARERKMRIALTEAKKFLSTGKDDPLSAPEIVILIDDTLKQN